jgi:hypothetical protein
MDVAGFSGRLRWCCNFHVGRAPLNAVARRRADSLGTFVGCKQAGPRANLNLPQICRLLNLSRWITLGGCIHDIDPNWQREFPSERPPVNLLRLVETCPNRAGEIRIVSSKQRISEIVSSAGLSCCGHFLQTELRKSSLSCP